MEKKEINKNVEKYIYPNFTKYEYDKNYIYKSFLDNFFIKGYTFFTRYDLGLRIKYFIMPLFLKTECIDYHISGDVFKRKSTFFKSKLTTPYWDLSLGFDENIDNMVIEMKKQAEPVFDSIENIEDFIKEIKKDKDNIRVFETIVYSTILITNDLEFQNKKLIKLIKEAEKDLHIEYYVNIKNDATLMLNTTTIEGRIQILKEWANYTISHIKLKGLKFYPYLDS